VAQYRFTITNDVPMVVDLDDSKFTLPSGTIYTGNKYEQIGTALFLDTNESGCISVDLEDVRIEPLSEESEPKGTMYKLYVPPLGWN